METLDTIIVGAGAAGIAAGCRLLENNVSNIIVLEAKNRIGGRIYSYEVDGSFLDIGGQWCHGQENNIVYSLSKELDILSLSINCYDDYKMYSPTLSLDKKLIDDMLEIAFNIERDKNGLISSSGSFGEYFINRFNLEIKQRFGHDEQKLVIAKLFCDWYHKYTACLNACPTWFDLSAKGSACYETCKGDYYLHFRNKGCQTILDVLMKKIPNTAEKLLLEDKIHLNKSVASINWNNANGVLVHCLDGSSYKAKCVLVTTSLGVLKKMHTKLFVPELPPYKVRVINELGFGTVNKIFLKFPVRWWSDDPKGISIIWTDEDKKFISKKNGKKWLEDIFGFYPIDSHCNILLVWIVGEEAASVEHFSDDDILQGLMSILQYYMGNKYNIPNPTGLLRSRWFSDSQSFGSYSYRTNASEDLKLFGSDLAKPLCVNNKPVLLFAGEATSDCHYSTIHGAINSGFREAERIIDFYKDTKKKSKL